MSTALVANKITIDGRDYETAKSVVSQGDVRKERVGGYVLPVAKTGTLTTRTDNNTGTLTMDSGHGITTGQRLDIYWTESGVKGHRRGVTVGSVSTNSVPIDLGAGDNLPTNNTAVTAQVPTEEQFLCTGDNAQYIAAKSSRRGLIVFADVSDGELFAVATPLEGDTGGGYQWYTGAFTNPLAGAAVTKVFFSNGDSSNTNGLSAVVGVN